MSNSSQPKNYSDDLINIDNISISISDDTMIGNIGNITIPTYSGQGSVTSSYVSPNTNTITLTGGYTIVSDTINLNQGYEFNWGDAQEWIDSFPDWQRVQDMCKKYPGLEIALRNFQTVYTLVKDDYDNPKDKI